MAVVTRKRKSGTVYFVATKWKGCVYFERSGTERREAERLDARRKREVAASTYQPPAARASGMTLRAHADRWLAARTNRSADHDEYLLGLVLEGEFGDMPLDEVRPRHVIARAREMQASRAHKSVTSAISVFGVMCRDAVIHELIPATPVVLPRGLLRRTYEPTEPYEADEVARLLGLTLNHRTLAALAFHTGMRPGEIAGRRWRDWDETARPLGALSIATQYDDQPLKGDDGDKVRPRVVPVHPALAEVLTDWRANGWPLVYAATPSPDDLIFPSRRDRARAYTRSGLLQLWHQAACGPAWTLVSSAPRGTPSSRSPGAPRPEPTSSRASRTTPRRR